MDENTAKAIAGQLRKPEGEEGIRTGKWMNTGNVHINRDAIHALAVSGNDNILEIGMGNGFFVQEIVSTDPSIKYTGVDFSHTMIREAVSINQSWIQSGQVQFAEAGANNLPFSSGAFNKIFTVNTLYFWDDAPKVLQELKRVLQPGGRLIIAIRPRRLMINYPFTEYGFRLYDKNELARLLEENRFSEIKIFENQEPDFEAEGQKYPMENLIVSATAE
jgi:ubiquinone/menaquinone biosynthesis C-methylase UbiE